MNKIRAFIKKTPGELASSFLLRYDDTVKRGPSVNQEVGSQQTPNLPAP